MTEPLQIPPAKLLLVGSLNLVARKFENSTGHEF